MGLMTYEEYMTNFLELLRYVPYIKDDSVAFNLIRVA